LTLSVPDLKEILEHGVAGVGPNQTPGSFAQVGGVRFTYIPSLPAGQRVQDVILEDNGTDVPLYEEGVLVPENAQRDIRIVTLSFLADGNDGYDFPGLGEDRVDLKDEPAADVGGNADFADPGTEQDALAEYLGQFYPDSNQPYDIADTPSSQDTRIEAKLFGVNSSTGNLIYYVDVTIDPGQGDVSFLISGLPANAVVEGAYQEGNAWRIFYSIPSGNGAQASVEETVQLRVQIDPEGEEVTTEPTVQTEYNVTEPELTLGPEIGMDAGDLDVELSSTGVIFEVTLETESDSQYVINYRNNLTGETLQTPPFTAEGTSLQWWDSGPPYTNPAVPGERFYMSYQKVLSVVNP
jgi:hypothetical protein